MLLLSIVYPISSISIPSAQAAYQTGSVFFGTYPQYLSAPNEGDFAVGTGDFTVEWWQLMTSRPDYNQDNAYARAWQIDGQIPFGVAFERNWANVDNPNVTFYLNSEYNFGTLTGFDSNYKNQWVHVAVTRTSSVVRMFLDGTKIGSDTNISYNFQDTTTPLTIGARPSQGSTTFLGHISNFHFVKGTSLYTTSFSRPTAPTNAVADTKLLLKFQNEANFLTDSSIRGKVVTYNRYTTWMSAAPPWPADNTVPTLSSTSLASNGLSIALNFSEVISSSTAPPSRYTVTLNGSESIAVNSTSIVGDVVTLNLASAITAGKTITLSYSDPTAGDDSNALQDDYGNDVATITNQPVRNITQIQTDYAYSSDGSGNKHFYSASSSGNQIPTTFTAEAWIHPTGLDCRGGSSANWSNTDVYCHILSKGNELSVFLASSSNNTSNPAGTLGFIYGGQVKYSKIKVPLNEWHHVAFSREGSGSGQSKIYFDGNLILEETTTVSGSDTTRDFTIGSSRSEGTSTDFVYGKFIGQIDEVRISKASRNSSEIAYDLRHHNGDSTSFLLYYDFNQDAGTALVNRAVGATIATDLTAVGSPSFDSSKILVTDTTTQSSYTIVKFYRDYIVDADGWTSPANVTSIRYMVIGGGGGGGGGWNGGGGGAGGYREANTTISPNTVYNVEIGIGGNGALYKYGPSSGSGTIFRNNSANSVLFQASGGGRGATEQNMSGGPIQAASSGGSGGGGAHAGGITAGSGNTGSYSPVEGYSGGQGYSDVGFYVGGGGGGAGGGGSAAGPSSPGAGGIGVTTYITGSQLKVAGGGAGAGRLDINGLRAFSGTGDGSEFGGGSGVVTSFSANASMDTGTAGAANKGGGGGGGATTTTGEAEGGAGGSGFIVLKYINKPVFLRQPVSDTITAGAVETFTVSTSAAVAPVTKSIKWQYTADTTTVVEANISGWTDVSSGTGITTDTFTTSAVTRTMNKYRYRAIVTFSDTSTITSVETSTIATLTVNDSIRITSDTSTITRKYGDTQTVRSISFTGGTAPLTVSTPNRALANGKIYLDTSTATIYFKVDTGTAVGSYTETVTVTDSFGVSASYTQRVTVNPADTLTVQADTLTTITYNPAGMSINPTVTITGLVASDTRSAITLTFSESTCAIGGTCSLGDTGPGGGTIFYISGSTYYEAAPKNWYSTVNYNGSTYTNSYVKFCSDNSYNTKNQNFSFTASTGWGGGKTNTAAFVNSANSGCTTGAVQLSNQYRGGGKDDWYIPNATELNALASYWVNRSAITSQFAETVSAFYWTSDASWNAQYGWLLTQPYFNSTSVWTQAGAAYNHQGGYIIPIRYFTASGGTQNLVGNPTNAGTYTITPSALTLANGVDTTNYVNVVYRSSQFIINKAAQSLFSVTSKLGDFKGNPSTMKLGTSGGTDTGTITFAIASGGTAGGCAISGESLNVTSAGTCKVVATKAATRNYLIAYSDTATITFSLFVSHQPVQTQSVPTQLPINGANALDTATVSVSTLVISSVTRTGAGAHTVTGTSFSDIDIVRIGGSDLTGSNYSVGSTTSISLSGVSSFVGPLFIRKTDGQEAVYFQIDWS